MILWIAASFSFLYSKFNNRVTLVSRLRSRERTAVPYNLAPKETVCKVVSSRETRFSP